MADAEEEIAKIMYWCQNPQNEQVPDLTLAISLWAQAQDMLEQIRRLPDEVKRKWNERMQATDSPTAEEMSIQLAELNGFLAASEEHQPDLFQQTLNQQLEIALREWITRLDSIETIDITDEEEEEEEEDLFDQRDRLEYTRMGINIIRFDYPRLKDVHYEEFASKLKKTDEHFRQLVEDNTKLLPYADNTFWWRQEQKVKNQNMKQNKKDSAKKKKS